MNYERGRGGEGESTSAISFSSALREIGGGLRERCVNPIKIKLITKGKRTHAQIKVERIVLRGWGEVVVPMERTDKPEIRGN